MKKPVKKKTEAVKPLPPVSRYDPEGSWTGTPVDHEKPVQDADDL